jgi:glycosyltransferase involved in cell wall biosynthesis
VLLSLKTFLPVPVSGKPGDITYTCTSILAALRRNAVDASVVVPRAHPNLRMPFVRSAIPRLLAYVPYRHLRTRALARATRLFLKGVAKGDVAYLWSEMPIDIARALRDRGIPMIREKFNCHKAAAREILDEAYRRLGWEPAHGITDAAVEKEREELALAEYVFAPSPLVASSLVSHGVEPRKVIPSSYGWEPRRLTGERTLLSPINGVTIVFVGLACVRKGVPLLLEAWARSEIQGRLVLAGRVDEEITLRCAALLNRPDVVLLGQVEDVGALYRSADIFAFPSLEEGSPLVSYEAIGAGLPSIVSPMGAGAVIQNGEQGFVVDPHDLGGWIDALRRLGQSLELRRSFGAAAKARAATFTWQLVGERRSALLRERFAPPGTRSAS